MTPFTPLPPGLQVYVVAKDGDQWGAYGPGFSDPALSDVAWAETPEAALAKLLGEVRVKAGPAEEASSP